MQLKHLLLCSLAAVSSISLFAGPDTDRKIETAIRASYNYRTLFEDKVTVQAEAGVVTLTGVVADKDMKSLAEDTVSDLPGVTRVNNQLTLDPALEEHSDAWMAWKIRYQLLVRASVSNRDTKVYVNDGLVTLTGTATTAAEKDLVGLYAAEVEGVKSVKNEILVMAAPGSEPVVAQAIDDVSINSQVKYALHRHKSTSALKTGVSTTDGVVVLTGVAANDAERALAGKLAESIRGVKSVTNDMTIRI